MMDDFQKLLHCEAHVKELEKEISSKNVLIGALKSAVDRLEYIMKQDQPAHNKMRSYVNHIRSLIEKNKKLQRLYDERYL